MFLFIFNLNKIWLQKLIYQEKLKNKRLKIYFLLIRRTSQSVIQGVNGRIPWNKIKIKRIKKNRKWIININDKRCFKRDVYNRDCWTIWIASLLYRWLFLCKFLMTIITIYNKSWMYSMRRIYIVGLYK